MFGRPGSSEQWGGEMDLLLVGKRRQARGDEEKMKPSVHVHRFEIKFCGKL
jgi:hypothetical protein